MKTISAYFIITICLLFPIFTYAEVVIGPCEVRDSPNGKTILQLDNGVGVQVLEAERDWSKIRFRITNPSTTVDGEFIKPNQKLHIFVQDFKWDHEYGTFGTTLAMVKVDKLPMGGPPTRISGYVTGYIKTKSLTQPRVDYPDNLSKLIISSYYRSEFVNLKTKTYDIDSGANVHPIFCDFRVTKGDAFHFAAGNYLEMLSAFDVDIKGTVRGSTCFETFCIEKMTIEGPDKFSIMVSGIKQNFQSTANLTEHSAEWE